MWSERLTQPEAEFTKHAIDVLGGVAWARPLLQRFELAGGLCVETKPLMFEVRLAYEIHRAGAVADYEHSAGVGTSTVDFRLQGEPQWLIEAVSIGVTDAAKRAIKEVGGIFEQSLSSPSTGALRDELAESPEAEMITAQQKIGEKAYTGGAPTKFPLPKNGVREMVHVILADMRGYMDGGADYFDYRQIALGGRGLPPGEAEMLVLHWETSPGRFEPIRGLFEKNNKFQRAAEYIQQRVHLLGFVCEEEYRDGEILEKAYYEPNPYLLTDAEEYKYLTARYPLLPPPRANA